MKYIQGQELRNSNKSTGFPSERVLDTNIHHLISRSYGAHEILRAMKKAFVNATLSPVLSVFFDFSNDFYPGYRGRLYALLMAGNR
ncbi:MAG: hypothetical protein ABS69_23420 [Nitrosomonadales bacterium SCN 54-20]|nr:MAG: hypothetical protein ABS69_23420 [Nitrosomonadales bacterium SCN 54-20]